MIDEYGIVTRTAGGKLAVKVISPGSCDSCPIHDNCYSSGKVVWLPRQEGIGVNDHVHFSISNASVLKVTALVYGVPLLGVMGGIILGYLLLFRSLADDPRTLASVGLGVFLFLAGGFLVSRLDAILKNRLSYSVVRAKAPSSDTELPEVLETKTE
ncbi:MAG TPA: SoxR reducing system RseC family protein [Spirochaetia bacterium]|nr:SoxR reducing system RseC family protein [Spirochaetia bacterium]